VMLPTGSFEQAASIGKLALFIGESQALEIAGIQHLYTDQAVFEFNAISANILNRCRADSTGNECQVLQPAIAPGNSVHHELMPVLTRSGLNQAGAIRLRRITHAF